MARPSRIDQQRAELLRILCRVFSELGYRRTTTAELARRCEVQENILYRLWPDKKAMFLAALDDLFEARARMWQDLLADRPSPEQAIDRLVAYEARHQGEFGFYRVVFTALAETDDPDIRGALVRMYRRFHRFVVRQPKGGQNAEKRLASLSPDSAAWALIGLATISNIIRELNLLRPHEREKMFAAVAGYLFLGARS